MSPNQSPTGIVLLNHKRDGYSSSKASVLSGSTSGRAQQHGHFQFEKHHQHTGSGTDSGVYALERWIDEKTKEEFWNHVARGSSGLGASSGKKMGMKI